MPYIAITQANGRSEDENRKILAAVTKAYSEVTGVDTTKIWASINEIDAVNWSIGGVNLQDKRDGKA